MAFDIDETLAGMLAAIRASVADDWSLVRETAADFLDSRKARLDLLADMRLQGEVDDAFVRARLDDERIVLESELHAISILTKAAAQRAANAAVDVLMEAIQKALPVL